MWYRRLAQVIVLQAGLWSSAVGAGQAALDKRGTVWVREEAPASFFLSLVGQLADLGWTPRRTERLPQTLGDHEVVVELHRDGPDLVVTIKGASGILGVRKMEGLGRGTAAMEGAALAVRGALPASASAASAPAAAGTPVRRPPSDDGVWGLRTGLTAQTWGYAPGTLGVEAGAFRRWKAWAVDLSVSGQWPQTLRDELAELTLTRLGAKVALRKDWLVGRGWSLHAGAAGGIALWFRSTETLQPEAQPESVRWLLGPSFSVESGALVRLGSRLGLDLAAGLEFLPGRPRYVYFDPSGAAVDARVWPQPWWAQPYVRLGLRWDPLLDGGGQNGR